MLNIIEEVVSNYFKDIPSIALKGEISMKKRMENIELFQNNKSIKICYLSLMSSAEGINLTAANNLVLVDTWWNNSKMIQVCDRIHRIGQDKEVTIYKLIIKNSIEEKIQKLVMKKSKIANLLVNKWDIDMSNYDETWISDIIKLI